MSISKLGVLLLGAVVGFEVWSDCRADGIGPGDFGGGVQIEEFDSLSSLDGTIFGPLALNGNTYVTESTGIRIFPPSMASTSVVCLGGNPEGHAANGGTCVGTAGDDMESMFISLGVPATRAGLWVGLSERISQPEFWALTDVTFFDEANQPLGSVEVGGYTYGFAGWEVGQDHRISRIQVHDIAANGRIVVIDRLMTELVPEPAGLSILLGSAILALLRRRR